MPPRPTKGLDLAHLQPLYDKLAQQPSLLEKLERRFHLRRVSSQGMGLMRTSDMLDLFEFLHALGHPHVAAWLAAQADPSTGHGVAYYLRCHATLGDVIQDISRLKSRLLPDGMFDLELQADHLAINMRPAYQAQRLGRQLRYEAGLVWLHRMLQFCVGTALPLQSASVMSPPSDKAHELASMLPAPIQFGMPAFRLRYARDVFDLRLPGYNPHLKEALAPTVEQLLPIMRTDVSMATRVVRWLNEQMDLSKASQQDVAQALHCGASSLRRKLADEGTSFAALLQAQRQQRAFDMVALQDLGMAHVADALGYSDRAALERAFRAWFGIRPAQMRSQLDALLPLPHERIQAFSQPLRYATPYPDDHALIDHNAPPASNEHPAAPPCSDEVQQLLRELTGLSEANAPRAPARPLRDEPDQAVLRHEWMLGQLCRALLPSQADMSLHQLATLQSLGALWLHQIKPTRMQAALTQSHGLPLHDLMSLERDLIGVDRLQAATLLMSAWQLPSALVIQMRTLAQNIETGEPCEWAQALTQADAMLRPATSNMEVNAHQQALLDKLRSQPLQLSHRHKRQRHINAAIDTVF
jgi:AraC-like DNA-binding protein